MAVGFTPKFTNTITPANFSKEHFIATAFKTIEKLKWKPAYISPHGLIAYTDNSMFIPYSEIRIIKVDDTITVTSISGGNEMIDFGRNKKNVENFINNFILLSGIIDNEEAHLIYNQLKHNFPAEGEQDRLFIPPIGALKSFGLAFLPVKGYFITPIIMLLNIAVFIVMVCNGIDFIQPSAESMLKWGANFKPLTLGGDWYRLFTSCFIHFGILHIALNMYALFYIGFLLEPRLGKSRFLAGYLLSGLIASAASMWWNGYVVSGGASGAIFGMYGLFLALLTTNVIDKAIRKPLLASIGIFVVLNLFNGSAVSGIDNAAHIGGLIGGFVIGYLFVPSLKKPHSQSLKFGGIILSVLLCAGVVYASLTMTADDTAKYDAIIKEFSINETKALKVYSMNKSAASKAEIVTAIKTGLHYWEQNVKIITKAEKLDLPEPLHKQNQILSKYCALRIESYNLLYKTIDENTQAYDNRISEINQEIDDLLKEISGEETQDPPPSK